MQRARVALKQILALSIFAAVLAGATNARAADNLQAFVNRLFQGKAGATIVSDPRTGRVLAVWDPQVAFKEAYTPGSTAKIVLSSAALEENLITPSDKILCRRVPRLLGEAYRCSHLPATSPYNLAAALANSCNYFFSELSTRVSSPALAHWYAVFGFGAAGEDASPSEVVIPDKARGKALAALGDLGIMATPAQVLLAYSAIAMRGDVYSLIMPGQQKAPNLERVVALRKTTFDVLAQGLRECVTQGLCRAAAVPGVSVAGKTGTAPALDGSRVTHAWFVAYAPADVPQVAVVVFLKRGTGSADAAPLAGRILRRYFASPPRTP